MNRIQAMAALAAGLLLAPLAWSAANAQPGDAQGRYQQERSACLNGQSHQDRATCLQEAGAAQEEARRGALANGTATDFENNATRRCEAQPPADRPACVQRILGAGNTQGSVEDGGLIRETETRLP